MVMMITRNGRDDPQTGTHETSQRDIPNAAVARSSVVACEPAHRRDSRHYFRNGDHDLGVFGIVFDLERSRWTHVDQPGVRRMPVSPDPLPAGPHGVSTRLGRFANATSRSNSRGVRLIGLPSRLT